MIIVHQITNEPATYQTMDDGKIAPVFGHAILEEENEAEKLIAWLANVAPSGITPLGLSNACLPHWEFYVQTEELQLLVSSRIDKKDMLAIHQAVTEHFGIC